MRLESTVDKLIFQPTRDFLRTCVDRSEGKWLPCCAWESHEDTRKHSTAAPIALHDEAILHVQAAIGGAREAIIVGRDQEPDLEILGELDKEGIHALAVGGI